MKKPGFISLGSLKPIAQTLVIGFLGGGLFFWLHAPLPWMLGAMVATTIAALCGVRISIPRPLRNGFIPVLGVMFGSVFDVRTLPGAGQLAMLTLLVAVYLLLTVGLGFLFFRRAGFDRSTSFFASVPGSFSEIILVADEVGADIRSVTLVHSARLLIAIPIISFSLQFFLHVDTANLAVNASTMPGLFDLLVMSGCAVAGYAMAYFARLPAPHMFGPLILSTAAHSLGLVEGSPPFWMIVVAQVMIGTFTGARFSGVAWRSIVGLFLKSAVWSILLLLIIGGYAAFCSYLLGLPGAALFLAFAPGGFAEISMIAMASGMGLALVTTTQFMRMTIAVIVVPLVMRVWMRKTGRRQPKNGGDRGDSAD